MSTFRPNFAANNLKVNLTIEDCLVELSSCYQSRRLLHLRQFQIENTQKNMIAAARILLKRDPSDQALRKYLKQIGLTQPQETLKKKGG